jgi:hypothetical protein
VEQKKSVMMQSMDSMRKIGGMLLTNEQVMGIVTPSSMRMSRTSLDSGAAPTRPQTSGAKKKKIGRKAKQRHSMTGSGTRSAVKIPLTTQESDIEAVRLRQNHELLTLLEKEQAAEAKRERELASARSPSDRKSLEDKYGQVRAKASDRILKMSEAHDRTLKKL